MFESVQFDAFTTVFIIVVDIIICGVVAVHILLNKHEEATSALAWLIIVFSFPIAGTLLYIVFGINRIYTKGVDIQNANDFVSSLKHDPKLVLAGKYFETSNRHIYKTEKPQDYPIFCSSLDKLMPDTMPLTGNRLELLLDGTKAYPKMIEEIEKAKSTIHLQSFIIMDDDVGKTILNRLEYKAKSGVKVKIIYDKFGSAKALFSFLIRKYGKNIPNFEMRPFSQFRLKAPWGIQLRNHRKVLVIDGKTAFVGGINISNDNISGLSSPDHYIHDLHCMINGPAVGELQMSFLRDWHYVSTDHPVELLIEEHFPLSEPCGDSIVRVIDSGPGQNYLASEKLFMTAAATAQKYVWIMTPYFVPDKPFWKLLCTAVARGVEIRIIVPRNNNHWYAQYATQSLYSTLLEAGIKIYEKEGSFSHAKAVLVDGVWAIMGSSNCDVRSFRLNYELDFVVMQGDFLDVLHSQFQKEMSESKEVLLEDILNKKLPQRLLENACSLLTPIL
ncbi:MAG TPA: cardiolipin synthase [Lentisphaeria bacterium]|nr:MAG: cardiolipin synthase [Lentisphaerae bacterium GWF2_50_93]HCE43862.1 cardiolipin synthase [Lentisphaeria bacterium]